MWHQNHHRHRLIFTGNMVKCAHAVSLLNSRLSIAEAAVPLGFLDTAVINVGLKVNLMPRPIENLLGRTFGALLVISFAGKSETLGPLWVCKCSCGKEVVRCSASLKNRHPHSCGCKVREFLAKMSKTHGQSGTREHRAWGRIKERCYRKNHDQYEYYGARGIKVCDRWLESFQNFIEDMGTCPPNMTIERIDCNGHYEPSNCKWATNLEQQNNKRTNVKMEWNGKILTCAQWARETGLSVGIIHYRLKKRRPIEKILTFPAMVNKQRFR